MKELERILKTSTNRSQFVKAMAAWDNEQIDLSHLDKLGESLEARFTELARSYPATVRQRMGVWKTATAYVIATMIGFGALTASYSPDRGFEVGGSVAYSEQSLASRLNNEGIRLYQQDRLSEAEGKFRQAISADKTYADAYSMLGSALLEQGRIDEATKYAEEAVRLTPYNHASHFILGKIYLKASQKNKALLEFKSALKVGEDTNDLSEKRRMGYKKYIELASE